MDVGVEPSLDGRQHLRAHLKPGGKTHNVTSAVAEQRHKETWTCAEITETQGGGGGGGGGFVWPSVGTVVGVEEIFFIYFVSSSQ